MSAFNRVARPLAWAAALGLMGLASGGRATAQDRITDPFQRTYAAARSAPAIPKDGGWRTIRVEYWSKAVFSFTYNVDRACDSIFEYASENGKGRKRAVAGMERVIKGMLLDVARFARVANEYFSLN